MENQSREKRVWLGIIFVSIGLLLILRNLGLLPFDLPYYLFSWKTALIGIGAYLIFVKRKQEPGLVLMIIGGIFFLRDITYFSIHDVIGFWPIVFIALGLLIIFRKRNSQLSTISEEERKDYIDELSVFSGSERVITSQNFKGGSVTSVFGGSDINLTPARLTPGTAVIDLFTLFGGSTIIVPSDWNVKVQVTAIFGAFDDSRKASAQYDATETSVLVVKGLVLFGGGEIKHQ